MGPVDWRLAALAVLGVSSLAWSAMIARRRQRAMAVLEGAEDGESRAAANPRVYPARFHLAGPACGAAVLVLLRWVWGWPLPIAGAFAVLAGVLGMLVEEYWAIAKIARIEEQLAEGIDLMMSSLRAGTPLLAAMELTREESRQPFREELEGLAGRMRMGDDPRLAVRQLAKRVPLETFRLFSHALLVHLETGSSLATTLRVVGATIRDRIEVSRRVRAQAVESQVSVVAILGITYVLAGLIYRSNPESMREFLQNSKGITLTAVTVLLEAIGILWIWRMSQIRY